MIFWVHKKSANVQSLKVIITYLATIWSFELVLSTRESLPKPKNVGGILNHPFFSFFKTPLLEFFFAKIRYVEFAPKIFEKKTLYKSYMLWSSHNLIHVYVSLWDVLTRLSILRLKFLSYIPSPYSTPREISGEIHRF